MARLREYIKQKLDDGMVRTVPIGNSLAPWRIWLEDGEISRELNWTGLQGVDRRLGRFEQFNLRLQAELGKRMALGLVRSWRRF